MIDAVYRRYRAVQMFLRLVGRNGEGYFFKRSPHGCNGTRATPSDAWKVAWDCCWKDWPGSKVYGRTWW